jgi:hypothetical protein
MKKRRKKKEKKKKKMGCLKAVPLYIYNHGEPIVTSPWTDRQRSPKSLSSSEKRLSDMALFTDQINEK